MNITSYVSDHHACGYVRMEVPAREINKSYPNHDMVVKGDILMSDYFRSNIMIFQRQFTEANLQKMLLAKSMGIKTIYEIDDDLFNLDPAFKAPSEFFLQPEIRDIMTRFLCNADAITTTTVQLAKALQASTGTKKPIFVVDNYLDVESWDSAFANKEHKDTITIGWMGSQSHVVDAPLVSKALGRLANEYPTLRHHFIGWLDLTTLPDLAAHKDRVLSEGWCDISELPNTMSDIDIGLCPLVDNVFNVSKSCIKWLQHSALGIPTVASNVGPYQAITHGTDGILVDNTEESWYLALKDLIDNEMKRKEIGCNARKTLLQKYDIRSNVSNWVSVFDQLMR